MQHVLSHWLELFGVCLAAHILVWRMFPLRREGAGLALIFWIGPALLLGTYEVASLLLPGTLQPLDWPSWGLALFLHFPSSCTYMVLYTLVTGSSPSIGILEKVEASMPAGLRREELAPKWFTDENLAGARRENLLATGFIYESGGLFHLGPRGRLIAGLFLMFRRFLGLPDVAKG